MGRYDDAVDRYRTAIELKRTFGFQVFELRSTVALLDAMRRRGRPTDAAMINDTHAELVRRTRQLGVTIRLDRATS
jgi:hypothetical protein